MRTDWKGHLKKKQTEPAIRQLEINVKMEIRKKTFRIFLETKINRPPKSLYQMSKQYKM